MMRDTRLTWAVYALAIAILATLYFADLRHFLHRADDSDVFRAHELISGDFALFFSADKPMASGRLVDEFALYSVYALRGNDPAAFHLLTVLVHALASFALAAACRRLGADMATSLTTGLLFLVNSAHVETVHWISALEYPFAILNASWTLVLYASYAATRRRERLWAFYGGMVICALTHFITVLLLPLCALWSWQRGDPLPRTIRDLAPLLPLLAPVLWFVFSLTGSHTTTQVALDDSLGRPLLLVAADGARSLFWLLGRLVSMAHWLPSVPGEWAVAEMWLGGAVLAALLCAAWKIRAQVQFWSAWTLLFALPFVPAVVVHASIARYVYLATAGSSFLLAWGLVCVGSRLGKRGPYLAGTALLALLASSYSAEERIANLTRYNTGRFFIVHEDPHVGIRLIEEAVAADRGLIPLGEAHLYMVEGALMVGDDYRDRLRQALRAVPDDLDLALLARLSALFAGEAEPAAYASALDSLAGRYAQQGKVFAARAGVLSQHLGNWYALRDDDKRAAGAYRASLRHTPHNLNTVLRLMEAERQLDNPAGAVAVAEEAWPQHRDNGRFLYAAALNLAEAGRPAEAEQAVRRGLEIQPTADLYALEGDLLAQRGLVEEAARAYQRAIETAPRSPRPQLLLARLYRAAGDAARAQQVLERTAGDHPDDALVHYNLGNIRYARGKVEAAAAAYHRAALLDPAHAQSHRNLGVALEDLGRPPAAERAYRRAIAAEPNNGTYHRDLGLLAHGRGDAQTAQTALEQALNLGADEPAVHTALARLHLDAGRRERALAAYRRFMQSPQPEATSTHYTQVGIGLYELGREDEAADAYHRALVRDAGDPAARTNLGWISFSQDRHAEAIAAYAYVLERHADPVAQFNLGLAYLASGDLERARAAYARGVERFGAAAAVRIGAVEDLRQLVERGVEPAAGHSLLHKYWPR